VAKKTKTDIVINGGDLLPKDGDLFAQDKFITKYLDNHFAKFSLHGHIHESPDVTGKWCRKLGNTICIQPGQLNGFTYVSIDLSSMKFNRVVE